METVRTLEVRALALTDALTAVLEPPATQGQTIANARSGLAVGRRVGALGIICLAGAAAYGGLADATLTGALASSLVVFAAVLLGLPGLHVVSTLVGSRLDPARRVLLVAHAAAFAGVALLAGVPLVGFFALAQPDSALLDVARVGVPVLAGVGAATVFLGAARSADPEGSRTLDVLWVALVGVLLVELALLCGLLPESLTHSLIGRGLA